MNFESSAAYAGFDESASLTTGIRYGDVMSHIATFAPTKTRASSLSTALRTWLAFTGRTLLDEVGPEFTSMYDEIAPQFKAHLVSEAGS